MLSKGLIAAVLIAVPSGAMSDGSRPPPNPHPIATAASTVSSLPNSGYGLRDSDAVPPVRFQRDTSARILTVSTQDELDADCGKPPNPKLTRISCIRGDDNETATIVLPNPCLPQFAGQDFAWRLCHELGHREGWGANHEP